mmetsp:Transcript_47651/g.101737  ORF Transcript_47651/g.101737 Transcript_47651/m.101737 type:complete len:121 (+) Transcript_47651:331-693(+)
MPPAPGLMTGFVLLEPAHPFGATSAEPKPAALLAGGCHGIPPLPVPRFSLPPTLPSPAAAGPPPPPPPPLPPHFTHGVRVSVRPHACARACERAVGCVGLSGGTQSAESCCDLPWAMATA